MGNLFILFYLPASDTCLHACLVLYLPVQGCATTTATCGGSVGSQVRGGPSSARRPTWVTTTASSPRPVRAATSGQATFFFLSFSLLLCFLLFYYFTFFSLMHFVGTAPRRTRRRDTCPPWRPRVCNAGLRPRFFILWVS